MDVEKDPLVFSLRRRHILLCINCSLRVVSLSSLRSAFGKYQKEPPDSTPGDRASSRVKEREREIVVVVSLFLHRRQKKAYYYKHVLGGAQKRFRLSHYS